MKKSGKILLITLGVILLLAVVSVIFGTMGMKEVRNFQLPSVDLTTAKDGKYEGACTIGRWAIVVEVEIKDQRIVGVKVTDQQKSNIPSAMAEQLNQAMITKQSCQVDAVGGATITSKAYMIAVGEALNRAGNQQK